MLLSFFRAVVFLTGALCLFSPLISGCKTSRNVSSVNSISHSQDTDGDGVPDFRDQCPVTDRGDIVDADGCIDMDGKAKRLPAGCRDIDYSAAGHAIVKKEVILKGLSGQCSWTGQYHNFTLRQLETLKSQKKQEALQSRTLISLTDNDLVLLDQENIGTETFIGSFEPSTEPPVTPVNTPANTVSTHDSPIDNPSSTTVDCHDIPKGFSVGGVRSCR